MSAKGPRYEAQQKGEKHYMSDKPCGRGHLSLRATNTGTCIECRKENERNRYHADPKKTKLIVKKKYDSHAEKIRQKDVMHTPQIQTKSGKNASLKAVNGELKIHITGML